MPRYHFRLRLHGQFLDHSECLELVGSEAAREKAHQVARALLELADSRIPWTEGVLVIESSDGCEPIILPIIDALTGREKMTHH
ncbi:hypothetical protein VQ02_07450 [Methylobacterium variabile]|jgi:hypothetical protein|uniref:DUF6894 domain-containing protein n=1 Tax=Methylobacterium variabile TaxID=298794 RepID=A0A0J6T3D0_9HYPH|nr:hypothetical protein VQ02_07450 [Methylobacterium variabile]